MRMKVRDVDRLRKLAPARDTIELRCDKCGGGVYLPVTKHNMRLIADKPRLVCQWCDPCGPKFYDR